MQNFEDNLQRRQKFVNRKTGFDNIDELQILAFLLLKSTRIFRTLQATSKNFAEKFIALLDKVCASLDIFIDYLQRVPRPPKMDLREGVSVNARALKDWQLKTNTTIIDLSSFNRDNYSAPVSFESFKETGEIEYSADVMWGLQLYCVNHASGKIFDDRQVFSDAKKQQPREMQLVCVKNREGNSAIASSIISALLILSFLVENLILKTHLSCRSNPVKTSTPVS